MPKKLPDETIRKIEKLYNEGTPIRDVARQTGVSYGSAYGYTRARQRGFKSLTELKDYQARQRINPKTGEQFKSLTELKDYQARQRGFKSLTELRDYQARQRINQKTGEKFKSRTEYLEHLARQRINPETGEKFKSRTEYLEHLARQRQGKTINQGLAYLISERLEFLGKSQSWLAEQVGVTESAVCRYTSGKTTPRAELQERLFKALELPYKTLDDFAEDVNLDDNHQI